MSDFGGNVFRVLEFQITLGKRLVGSCFCGVFNWIHTSGSREDKLLL